MLFYLISIIAAFFAGAYFSPAFKVQNNIVYFCWSASRGVRNQTRLFKF